MTAIQEQIALTMSAIERSAAANASLGETWRIALHKLIDLTAPWNEGADGPYLDQLTGFADAIADALKPVIAKIDRESFLVGAGSL